MKKISLDTWIQLVGLLSVLAGLVFVGLEMRLSRNIALASQIQARSNQGLSHMDTYIEAGIDWLGVSYPETYDATLTQYEIIKRNEEVGRWLVLEADYAQYTQGLMTEDFWEAKSGGSINSILRCEARDVYEVRILRAPAGLQELIEEQTRPSCN